MKILITGAGLSGATSAVILSRAGHDIRIGEGRAHLGGNCYDEKHQGVTVHKSVAAWRKSLIAVSAKEREAAEQELTMKTDAEFSGEV